MKENVIYIIIVTMFALFVFPHCSLVEPKLNVTAER